MANPYLLPEGNVAIAFSGGRTSAYMLHQIAEANGGIPARCVVGFMNTGREMPETLDFVQECSDRWSIPVVWLEYRVGDDGGHSFEIVSHNSASRNGSPFEALVRKKGYLPNRVARYCTADLKVRTFSRYLKGLGWVEWSLCLGIRADERRRLDARSDGREHKWYPLASAGVSKRNVAAFWRKQPFDLRLANINGSTPLGNCDGCFLKSEANRAAFARDYPERAQWWVDMEALASGLTSRKSGATFRPKEPWHKLISFVNDQGDWLFDDTNAALCQADDGECL